MKPMNNPLRFDLQIIASWIEQGTRVLGLGCGEGDLLHFLRKNKGVTCTGIELNEDRVAICIAKGLTVLQGDINQEVLDYPEDAFDYVILSQTLQQIYEPGKLIGEILCIGKKCVVSFPNFGHWNVRLQLLTTGRAPLTEQLPYDWYNTPNIRVISMEDFRRFSRKGGFSILKEVAINTDYHEKSGHVIKRFANLRATYGIFLIGKKASQYP